MGPTLLAGLRVLWLVHGCARKYMAGYQSDITSSCGVVLRLRVMVV
jgi:hypothetical protein